MQRISSTLFQKHKRNGKTLLKEGKISNNYEKWKNTS